MLLEFLHSHSPCTRDDLVELVVCIPIYEVRRLLAGLFGNACNNFRLDLACEIMRGPGRTYLSCDHEMHWLCSTWNLLEVIGELGDTFVLIAHK
jgi:hypothetical protein